jgi:hypothetical protein
MVNNSSAAMLIKEQKSRLVEQPSNARLEGFDFLRAIFSIAVVALKTEAFLLIELFSTTTVFILSKATFAYLAVPVFLQISLFLLYIKSEETGLSYFLRKRLPRLVYLYIFWVGLKVLFDVFVRKELWEVAEVASSTRGLVEFIVSGSHSPFFFFFALIFLSTLASTLIFAFKKFRIDSSRRLFLAYGLLVASCLFVFGLSVTEIALTWLNNGSSPGIARSISSIAFWDYNPFSFLPYLFTALISAQEFQENKLRNWSTSFKLKLGALLSLSIFFTILEWHLFDKMLHYSRLSLVFGSWFFLYLALTLKLKAPPIIKSLSACSLGIYGFHVFFMHPLLGNKIWLFGQLFERVPGLAILVEFAVVLASSIALTVLFKKFKIFKNYV